MRTVDIFRLTICLVAFVGAVAVKAADLSSSDVTKSLQTIKSQADALASGKAKSPGDLRDAARTIGVEWQKVEPSVAKEYLVETKFANQSISMLEQNWQDANRAKAAAQDVSAKVSELLSAQQSTTTAPQ